MASATCGDSDVDGDDAACYALEAQQCADPLLRSVHTAFVLTMADCKRFDTKGSTVHCLCARTFVQRNRGFRRCRKPGFVQSTSTDLVHAYREVALRARGMGNVLILEDDAQVLAAATRADFAEVDAFVAHHAFDVYSLGSTGFQRPSPHAGHMRLSYTGASHAIIWSEASRAHLLEVYSARLKHIDGCFLVHLPLIYTYRDPLVGQLYTRTENSYSWSHLGLSAAAQARGGPLVWFDQRLVGVHMWWLGVRFGLDRDTRGWAILYRNERRNAVLVDHGVSAAWCMALVGLALALVVAMGPVAIGQGCAAVAPDCAPPPLPHGRGAEAPRVNTVARVAG
jgi:hypothetical protein